MKNYLVQETKKKLTSNMAAVFVMLSGITYIIFAFMNFYQGIFLSTKYYGFLQQELYIVNRDLCITIGCILIFLAYRLHKKMRIAWLSIIGIKLFFLISTMILHPRHFNIFFITDFLIISILISCSSSFNKKTDIGNIRKATAVAVSSFLLLIVNTSFRLILLKAGSKNMFFYRNEFFKSFQMMYFINFSYMVGSTKAAIMLEKFFVILNWSCIILVIYFLMKPKTIEVTTNDFERNKVKTLLSIYGDNSVSYFLLDNSNIQYYFSKRFEGVIGYIIKYRVAVCIGDPICSDNNVKYFIEEFLSFCNENELNICFCHTTEKYIDVYRQIGLNVLRCGKEPIFNLFEFDFKLAGKKGSKLRESVNRANREGINVIEYNPSEKRNDNIEKQISEISAEWLSNKNGGELTFLLGNADMNNIGDKRIFIGIDSENKVQAFIIFNPFNVNDGYLADVTRKRLNAPHGIMEKINLYAFERFKNEGIKWASLGLVPLCHLKEESTEKRPVISMCKKIYERNLFLHFNSLYNYKNKYYPTSWNTRYIVYNSKILAPKIIYSVIKSIVPSNIRNVNKKNTVVKQC